MPGELGVTGSSLPPAELYPGYVRGEAYLAASQGGEAAAELQKALDHSGLVLNEPIAALAHVGFARAARALAGICQGSRAIRAVLRALERCRPQYPHSQTSQSGVPQAPLIRS